MAQPEILKKYYELDLVDRTIVNIVETLEDEIKPADINKVKVAASVQAGLKLQQYRKDVDNMDPLALRKEDHSSPRLGFHLEEKFGARPNRVHAHAIVAGKHPLAATARLRMSKMGIRIDDGDNGCWLPENSAATPHPAMPHAPPHSRIHRYNYYFWLSSKLDGIREGDLFRTNLKIIAQQLYTGKMPDYVMLRKGTGLPK